VAISRSQDSLPSWARHIPSAFHEQEGVADQMKYPWFYPPPGEVSSTIVRWAGNKFHFEMDPHRQCPLQPGDHLAIIIRFNLPCEGVSFRTPVTLNVEYAPYDDDEE